MPRTTTLHPSKNGRLPTTYEPLSFVLEEIELLHKELQRILRRVVPHFSDDVRAEYLRGYWKILEAKRMQAIRDYCEDGDKQLLGTWAQYIPLDDLVDHLRNIQVDANTSFDDLVAWLTEFNQELVQFYRRMSRTSSADRVDAMFSDLANQTEREAVQLSWRLRDE